MCIIYLGELKMKVTKTYIEKVIKEELKKVLTEAEDVYTLQKSKGDYQMKDGTDFDVDVYRDNSGEETLRVTVKGAKKLVGKVEDKEKIIKKLQSMDFETAKQPTEPLHGIKA